MTGTESIGFMEPMLPPDRTRELEDLAIDLATRAAGLASQLPPSVRRSIGDLVRSMNCYYSTLIEGHDMHPRDIDRALAHADYSLGACRSWNIAAGFTLQARHIRTSDIDNQSC